MYDVDVEVAERDVAVVEVVAVDVADRAEGAKNCAVLCRRVLSFMRCRQGSTAAVGFCVVARRRAFYQAGEAIV